VSIFFFAGQQHHSQLGIQSGEEAPIQIDGLSASIAQEEGPCWGWVLGAASAALPGVRLGQKATMPAACAGAAG